MTFNEAKSRHITPAVSAHDFQKFDKLLIKSGETITRKVVSDLNYDAGTVTATDPDGSNPVTISLNPNSPAKDGGEFKYWIDESEQLQEFDGEFDSEFGDEGDADLDDMMYADAEDFTGEYPDEGELDPDDAELGIDPELDMDPDVDEFADVDDFGDETAMYDESFKSDLNSFLGEEGSAAGSQVPDNTVGGSVDDAEHSDEDGEDPEDTPAPHDNTGHEDGGQVDTMAGDSSSNVGGSAPSDEVATHGDVGGAPQSDQTMPTTGEHEPGDPDKAKGVSESVRTDVKTALGLVERGADPKKLAGRLLRGAC